jgi:hypothetical protein
VAGASQAALQSLAEKPRAARNDDGHACFILAELCTARVPGAASPVRDSGCLWSYLTGASY